MGVDTERQIALWDAICERRRQDRESRRNPIRDFERARRRTVQFADLPPMIRNTLAAYGIETRDEVAALPDELLLSFRNIGRVSLKTIRQHIPYSPPQIDTD